MTAATRKSHKAVSPARQPHASHRARTPRLLTARVPMGAAMRREPRSGPPGSELADRLPALLDPRGLAAQRPQVVQLGAAHLAPGHDFDRLGPRGVKWECALHPDAVAGVAPAEGLARPAA